MININIKLNHLPGTDNVEVSGNVVLSGEQTSLLAKALDNIFTASGLEFLLSTAADDNPYKFLLDKNRTPPIDKIAEALLVRSLAEKLGSEAGKNSPPPPPEIVKDILEKMSGGKAKVAIVDADEGLEGLIAAMHRDLEIEEFGDLKTVKAKGNC